MTIDKESTIFLFDVDGTLTPARQPIAPDMWDFLKGLKERVALGIVGGSDFSKIVEQLNTDSSELFTVFDYIFAENGLCGFQGANVLPTETILDAIGEEKIQDVINFCLNYMSTIQLPLKRGNFVEFRKGMLNVTPMGRSCTQAERNQFIEYEKHHPVREQFVAALREKFANYNLSFAIGGQISIDIFPRGWDKTYCLRYLTPKYSTIHFFGDRTQPGGNDHEIYEHPSTIGYTVQNPEHTRQLILKELLN